MAKRQDKKWQPSGLERLQQSERDKKMGIFRRKKQVPPKKKEVRVEEFKFDKVFEFPDITPKPGQIIQWGRRTGNNDFYRLSKELQKELQERGLPMPDYSPTPEGEKWEPRDNPFGRGRNTRLDDSKYRFAMEVLGKKHRCQIEVEQGFGDYVVFRTRGRRMDTMFRLSHTQIASVHGIEQLMGIIERGLDLEERTPGKKLEEHITDKPKTPTDAWAEKWAKENA